MHIHNCPGCLKPDHKSFCRACLRKLFGGKTISPILPFSKPEFNSAKLSQGNRISISGVQTKHSLKLNKKNLELTDQGGEYILKPIPKGEYDRMEEMPANEHVTMQIAEQVFGLNTAANALVFFKDGEPAYLTKRFDRNVDGSKSQQEDFAQLAGRSEDTDGLHYKYDSSYQEIADLMQTFIAPYAIEVEKFFRLVLFNYLIHNGDAHLKNFSLIRDPGKGIYVLAPAYD
ncbi:MAG: HipA domain-containing protein, partial [Fibrobacterota bacterium]|nr:HipA domain-containing protein [Fibrobacterota bacterium]